MPSLESDEPRISLATAVIVGLLASLAQSFGLTLQRKSHLENEAKLERVKDWKRPLWVIGFAIFLLSNSLGSIFQLGVLPIVVLAPLGGVSLCWNALFAKLVLGDSFSRYLVVGTLLIGTGACLIAVFGSVPEPAHSLDELLALYNRSEFIIWISLQSFCLIGSLVAAHVTEWSLHKHRHARKQSYGSVATNGDQESLQPFSGRDSVRMRRRWSEPLDQVKINMEEDAREVYLGRDGQPISPKASPSSPLLLTDIQERKSVFTGIVFGGASGIMSGLCLLFAKTGTELLVLTLGGENQFNRWQSWMIVMVLVIAALLQLWYLNKALRLLGPTLVCPLAFCFYNLSSIFNGLVYYDQWRLLSHAQIALVAVGIAVLFVGVWIVSLKTTDEDPVEDEGILSERTPLMAEPLDGQEEGLFPEDSSDDEMASRRTDKLRTLKKLFSDYRPRGLSFGLNASSPGFAIRPEKPGKLRAASQSHSGHPSHSASFSSLPSPARNNPLADSTSSLGSLNNLKEPHRSGPRRFFERSVTGSIYTGGHSKNRSLDLYEPSPINLSPGNPRRAETDLH